ncbi:MAG: hypothetical protein ACFFAQ_05335 [Promethearchaeota archaeon]
MKNHIKIVIICLACLMAFSALTPMVYGGITIDDTTFPADVGKRYVWRYTHPSVPSGFKFGFTADSITQGTHNFVESLIVYATIEMYIPVNNTGWTILIPSEFYLAANETQGYLYFNNTISGWPFVITTPINLTLVGEVIVNFSDYDFYSIDKNTIIFEYRSIREEYTFKNNGFLSVAEAYHYEELMYKLVYGVGGDKAIPFNNYFIVPAFVTIAIISIFVKKRCSQIK